MPAQLPYLLPEHLLTVSECARRLNVSESWVRRHRRELGAVRLGRSLRFDPVVLFRRLNIEFEAGKTAHPKLVSSLLGHSRVNLAMDVYDHVEVADLYAPMWKVLPIVTKTEVRA